MRALPDALPCASQPYGARSADNHQVSSLSGSKKICVSGWWNGRPFSSNTSVFTCFAFLWGAGGRRDSNPCAGFSAMLFFPRSRNRAQGLLSLASYRFAGGGQRV
jgi:hypothetical protein